MAFVRSGYNIDWLILGYCSPVMSVGLQKQSKSHIINNLLTSSLLFANLPLVSLGQYSKVSVDKYM